MLSAVTRTGDPCSKREKTCRSQTQPWSIHRRARPRILPTSPSPNQPHQLPPSPSNLASLLQQNPYYLLQEYVDISLQHSSDIRSYSPSTTPYPHIRVPLMLTPCKKKILLQLTKEKKHVRQMLDKEVGAPSSGPWSSYIVLVQKNDGLIRFCEDCWKLYDAKIRRASPLPV